MGLNLDGTNERTNKKPNGIVYCALWCSGNHQTPRLVVGGAAKIARHLLIMWVAGASLAEKEDI